MTSVEQREFEHDMGMFVDMYEAAQEQHRAEVTLPLCSMCECKSADCAYGDLRGGQSCYDTQQRYHA